MKIINIIRYFCIAAISHNAIASAIHPISKTRKVEYTAKKELYHKTTIADIQIS